LTLKCRRPTPSARAPLAATRHREAAIAAEPKGRRLRRRRDIGVPDARADFIFLFIVSAPNLTLLTHLRRRTRGRSAKARTPCKRCRQASPRKASGRTRGRAYSRKQVSEGKVEIRRRVERGSGWGRRGSVRGVEPWPKCSKRRGRQRARRRPPRERPRWRHGLERRRRNDRRRARRPGGAARRRVRRGACCVPTQSRCRSHRARDEPHRHARTRGAEMPTGKAGPTAWAMPGKV
jgi:hypothetical protein